MDDLYRNAAPNPESSFNFNDETVKDVIYKIYRKEIDPVNQIDRNLLGAVWDVFNKATDEGFSIPDSDNPDFDFYKELKQNNGVFSAFRVHRMQNDMAAQLIGEDGILKPFEQYLNDVWQIADHHVKHWLHTEYDTAVIRAHQAADWRQFEREKDILPNLTWMPTTSAQPDKVHRQYWSIGLTLPVGHPFWNSHRPGDRWGCKCSLQATDEPPTEINIPTGGEQPDAGLDNNPAADAKLFSDSHPYIKEAYKGAKEAVKNILFEIEKSRQ